MQEGTKNREAFEQYTDEELILRLHRAEDGSGDTQIMDFLMDKYKNLVRKKSKVMFLIGGDTDDLIQEGMIGLFKAIRDYRLDKDSSFFHFAEICISRQMYTAIEASNRKKHAPLNSYISLSEQGKDGAGEQLPELLAAFSGSNPEQLMIDRENVEQMKKRIDEKLSGFEKEVLAYYMQGMNYVQIAEIMSKTAKSVDNALQRIKAKLK